MQLPKETVLTVTSVVPSALTVPLWVPAICSTLSLPGARVFIGKVQVPQVTDSIEPLTNSACSSLPFAVDSEHSSIVKPSVLTSVALVPDLRLKSRLVPAAQRLASGQGVSWVVQKTELAALDSTDSVFSFGSVSVYSAVHLAVSGQAALLPVSFFSTALTAKVAGLPSFSSPRSTPAVGP